MFLVVVENTDPLTTSMGQWPKESQVHYTHLGLEIPPFLTVNVNSTHNLISIKMLKLCLEWMGGGDEIILNVNIRYLRDG